MATKESSELFSEMPLFELRERFNKSEEGKKFLQEAILDRHSATRLIFAWISVLTTACLRLALDQDLFIVP